MVTPWNIHRQITWLFWYTEWYIKLITPAFLTFKCHQENCNTIRFVKDINKDYRAVNQHWDWQISYKSYSFTPVMSVSPEWCKKCKLWLSPGHFSHKHRLQHIKTQVYWCNLWRVFQIRVLLQFELHSQQCGVFSLWQYTPSVLAMCRTNHGRSFSSWMSLENCLFQTFPGPN